MSRTVLVYAVAALALCAGTVSAQEPVPEVPEDMRVKKLPRQKLSGPRFGFTVFTGETADQRDSIGLEPMMTQFGWQWETQIVSMQGGSQALMEWVLLVGGVEQSEFSLSLGWLAGYRLDNGVEFGVGPNLSVNKDNDWEPNTSMVFAAGSTLPFGDLYLPLNLAVSVAKGGPRITMLMGWIVG